MIKFDRLKMLCTVLVMVPAVAGMIAGQPTSANCTEQWFTQLIDHFDWADPVPNITTYQQRYYVCDQFWQPGTAAAAPIFWYYFFCFAAVPSADVIVGQCVLLSCRLKHQLTACHCAHPRYFGNEDDITLCEFGLRLMLKH